MTILLSEIYDVTLKRGIRGASKANFIRPTISQFFMSNHDFEEIIAGPLYYEDATGPGLGTASADSTQAGSAANAFNNTWTVGSATSSYWLSTYNYVGDRVHWLQWTFLEPKIIEKITIISYANPGEYISDFKFQGDAGSNNWIDLLTVVDYPWVRDYNKKEFLVENDTVYTKYRLYFTGTSRIWIQEAEFMVGVYS